MSSFWAEEESLGIRGRDVSRELLLEARGESWLLDTGSGGAWQRRPHAAALDP